VPVKTGRMFAGIKCFGFCGEKDVSFLADVKNYLGLIDISMRKNTIRVLPSHVDSCITSVYCILHGIAF
jgi:hypothetical protein